MAQSQVLATLTLANGEVVLSSVDDGRMFVVTNPCSDVAESYADQNTAIRVFVAKSRRLLAELNTHLLSHTHDHHPPTPDP